MCDHPRLMDTNGIITPFSCGQCLCCRINKAREWKHRILLEMTEHKQNAFITLTYQDENLPKNGTLSRKDLTNFLKRLRHFAEPNFRYFAVGEYGEDTYRPHYHLAAFGWNPMNHERVAKTWKKGWTMTGDLNNNSAAYLVGYTTSKVGKIQDTKLGPDRIPMFTTMSKMKGGLGIGAVYKMAEQIKNKEHFEPKLIKQVMYGKQAVPLGRYLTKKLAEKIGVPESEQLTDFWQYQEEVLGEYLENGNKWYEELQKNTEPARIAKKARHKLFTSKRRTM